MIFHNGHNIELLDVSDLMSFDDCFRSNEAESDNVGNVYFLLNMIPSIDDAELPMH